jgi:hypothetical protein
MSDQEKARAGGQEEAGFGGIDAKKRAARSGDKGQGKSFNDWWEDRSLAEKIAVGIGFGILVVGLLFLFGLAVMALWNWLMPEIFGLKRLNYWQSWGLLVLSCILLGRIGGSGSGSSDRKRKRKLRSYMREDRSVEGEAAEGSAKA